MFQPRQATIFGGSGFLGRYIVKRLAAAGTRIVVAGRRARAATHLLTAGDVGQIVLVDIDIADEAAVAAALRGSDTVINLVGILFEAGRQRFDRLHRDGAGRIARQAREAGARRVLQVSAIGADPNSASLYARTKAAGEAAMRAEFPATIVLRPSIVFGPEDNFFNQFADLATRLPFLPLIGGGNTRFQPVYVGDVAQAVEAALVREDTGGATYELGGPHIYSFRELMLLVRRETGRKVALLPLPFPVARLQAALFSLLPKPLLTQDQITLLQRDNIVTPGAPGLAELGIEPMAVELIVPEYLARFRRGGWFSTRPGLENS